MSLVLAAVYFLIRYFEFNDLKALKLKNVMKDFDLILAYVFRGVLCACVVLLPAIYHVTHISSRLNGANVGLLEKLKFAFKASNNMDDFGTRMSRLMSNNMIMINDSSRAYFGNYYETPQLFITIFIFFFLGQWLVNNIKEMRSAKKIVFFALKCVLIPFFIFNKSSGFIMNGFAYPAYRYKFTVVIFLALMVVKAWEAVSKKGFSAKGIGIGGVLSAFTWIFSRKHMSSEVSWYVNIVLICLIIGTLLQCLAKISKLRKIASYAFAIVVIATTCYDGCVTTNQRKIVSEKFLYEEYKYTFLCNSTLKAVNWLKAYDASFYGIEKNYVDWHILSDSLIYKYSTHTFYDTIVNKKTIDFFANIYPTSATSMESVKVFAYIK